MGTISMGLRAHPINSQEKYRQGGKTCGHRRKAP
jgi:hypothetical protein